MILFTINAKISSITTEVIVLLFTTEFLIYLLPLALSPNVNFPRIEIVVLTVLYSESRP